MLGLLLTSATYLGRQPRVPVDSSVRGNATLTCVLRIHFLCSCAVRVCGSGVEMAISRAFGTWYAMHGYAAGIDRGTG